jgi:hypothetical protein
MSWMPHDLGTWGFILSLATLILAIPLGIAGTLLAPRVQAWLLERRVRNSVNQLQFLTEYRAELESEALFSPTETILLELGLRLIVVCHFLVYFLVLCIVFSTHWQPQHHHLRESARDTLPLVIPFATFIIISLMYCVIKITNHLRRSSPRSRTELENRINALLIEIRQHQTNNEPDGLV